MSDFNNLTNEKLVKLFKTVYFSLRKYTVQDAVYMRIWEKVVSLGRALYYRGLINSTYDYSSLKSLNENNHSHQRVSSSWWENYSIEYENWDWDEDEF